MMRFYRPRSELLLSLGVALALGIFIILPIATVLGESFVISGPMSPQRLAQVTTSALGHIPQPTRQSTIDNWIRNVTPAQRVDAMAAAYTLAGIDIDWDRKAAYSDQSSALDASLQRLTATQRELVESHFPLATIMLFKRIPLAFNVRAEIGQAAFDNLRSGEERRLGLDHYSAIFFDPYLRGAMANSLSLATVSTLLTVAVAFLITYGIHTNSIPWPAATRTLMVLPLVSPPVLTAIAILMLFGRNGLFTHTLLDQTLHLIDADRTNIYGFGGIVAVQILSHVPPALIVLDDVLRRRDGRLEDAASGLGAGHIATLRHVTLPLSWPGIKRAIVLVFILSLTDFGNPLLIGRGTPVLAGIIYDQITAFQNHALAAALCVWLLVPPLLLYLALETIGRRRRFATPGTVTSAEFVLPSGWRIGLSVLSGLFVIATVAIYGTMISGAFVRSWGTDWTPTLAYFNGQGIDNGLAGTGYGSSDRSMASVWSSLQIAAFAGPIGGLFAVLTAYVSERVRPPGANLLAFTALIPALLPGIIFGIGYIIAFNTPFGVKSLSLLGTSTIIVLNIVFSKVYVGILAARAALQRYDQSIEDAAESLGAGLFQRFTRITLPMLRTAFMLGTLYVFVESMTTLSSVIFLVSGGHKLAAVEIFNHANDGDFGFAASKSLVIFVIALVAISVLRRIDANATHRRDTSARRLFMQARPRGDAKSGPLRPA